MVTDPAKHSPGEGIVIFGLTASQDIVKLMITMHLNILYVVKHQSKLK